ncbi:hypothetical protein RVL72_23880, partial [Enterobacter hormaechei subsp. xiangfangensis]|uniref:hypothetical protein n=1 Tax=Enterobacter hormaechei TaxID=158836 RepID=UPI0039C9C597
MKNLQPGTALRNGEREPPDENSVLDEAVAAAERASGKKLNQPNRHSVLTRARAQIESQRRAERQRSAREAERQQADVTWSRPRAPRRGLPLSSVVGGVLGGTAWYSLR